jgi:hypothetical protein
MGDFSKKVPARAWAFSKAAILSRNFPSRPHARLRNSSRSCGGTLSASVKIAKTMSESSSIYEIECAVEATGTVSTVAADVNPHHCFLNHQCHTTRAEVCFAFGSMAVVSSTTIAKFADEKAKSNVHERRPFKQKRKRHLVLCQSTLSEHQVPNGVTEEHTLQSGIFVASNPPSKGRTHRMPLRRSINAIRALLTSFGDEQ